MFILPYLGDLRTEDIALVQGQTMLTSVMDKSYSLQMKILTHLWIIFRAVEEKPIIKQSPASNSLNPAEQDMRERIRLTTA